ncbi:MAG TPA: 6-phosphofructokinase, partial [Lacipirellula sp.]
MDFSTTLTQQQLDIATLGPPTIQSPLNLSTTPGDNVCDFTPDETRLSLEPRFNAGAAPSPLGLERGGPRKQIFFEPSKTKAAIVTCGGLCPGINNVIRTAVFELMHNYGVPSVLGIRYGFEGLNPAVGRPPIELTPDVVSNIHHHGGTMLGSSRGPQEPSTTVE